MDPDTPITTLEELADVWRWIDGGHGYSAPQVFALILDRDGHLLPQILQMYDEQLGMEPDDATITGLVSMLQEAVDAFAGDGSIALMRARPGRLPLTADDTSWCRALHRGLRDATVDTRPLFFATDDSVGPVAPDTLVSS